MAQRFPDRRIILVFLAAALVSACSDYGGGALTNGLVSSPTAAVAVHISPLQPQLAPAPLASCTMTQPFSTHFDLVLGPASVDVFLEDVVVRFDDGLGGRSLLFGKDDLDVRFGTRHIPAQTARTFAFDPAFGCEFSARPRSLAVTVTMRDGRGQRQEATATATIG